MSTQTHDATPGPWTFIPETVNQSAAVYGEDGWVLADVKGRDEETATARARLIAAAPQLLKALEALLTSSHYPTHERSEECRLRYLRARFRFSRRTRICKYPLTVSASSAARSDSMKFQSSLDILTLRFFAFFSGAFKFFLVIGGNSLLPSCHPVKALVQSPDTRNQPMK
jgi:hypothetical protein